MNRVLVAILFTSAIDASLLLQALPVPCAAFQQFEFSAMYSVRAESHHGFYAFARHHSNSMACLAIGAWTLQIVLKSARSSSGLEEMDTLCKLPRNTAENLSDQTPAPHNGGPRANGDLLHA